MSFKVFYLFDRSAESVSSASALEMGAREICDQLLPRLQTEDDYLGVIDTQENVLQVLRESGSGRYWVELPIDAAKASYGRHMELADLRAFILELPEVFDREAIPGLEYRPW